MANNMLLEFILGSVILFTGSTVNSQDIIATKCLSDDTKCYTLYAADLTWQAAYNSCLSRNQHLATIQNAQTQSIMEMFASDDVYPVGAAHAWVAGKRSEDMTWRHLDGQVFNYDGYILHEGDGSRLCMLLNGFPGYASDHALHLAVRCYDQTPYKAVCEYDRLPGAGCPNNNITIHQPSVNKCNTVSVERYQSWHDARQYCHSQGWQLAHTGAGSWDFYKQLTGTDKPLIRDESAFWIDVQRRLWEWIINGTEKLYPSTTYWRSQEGVSSTEECMHIELNDRGMWADKPCDVTSFYFVCEYDKDETTNAVPPAASQTTPSTSTTTHSEDKMTEITTKPPGDGDGDGLTTPVTSMPHLSSTEIHEEITDGPTRNLTFSPAPLTGLPLKTVYIIVGVAGGVLLVIIIIVAVICVRRRRKESPSPNTTAATEVENPPQTNIGDDHQPYAEVRQFNNSPEQNTPSDPSSPYPLYDEAAAVRIDRIPTPELYYKAADEKDPMAPEFTGSDRAVSSGESGPSQIVTNDGDVYSLPVKKSSLKQDDDLEIIDNPTYGAA